MSADSAKRLKSNPPPLTVASVTAATHHSSMLDTSADATKAHTNAAANGTNGAATAASAGAAGGASASASASTSAAIAAAVALDRRERERDESDAAQLATLLDSLKEYESTIPDAVITHFMERAGANCSDVKLKRLIAVATQKFIYEICRDASNYRKLRVSSGSKDAKKDAPRILAMEDLSSALEEHGIDVIKPPYYADRTAAASTAAPTSSGAAAPAADD